VHGEERGVARPPGAIERVLGRSDELLVGDRRGLRFIERDDVVLHRLLHARLRPNDRFDVEGGRLKRGDAASVDRRGARPAAGGLPDDARAEIRSLARLREERPDAAALPRGERIVAVALVLDLVRELFAQDVLDAGARRAAAARRRTRFPCTDQRLDLRLAMTRSTSACEYRRVTRDDPLDGSTIHGIAPALASSRTVEGVSAIILATCSVVRRVDGEAGGSGRARSSAFARTKMLSTSRCASILSSAIAASTLVAWGSADGSSDRLARVASILNARTHVRVAAKRSSEPNRHVITNGSVT